MSVVHKIHLGNTHRRKLVAKTRQLTENDKVRMHVCRRHPRVFVLQHNCLQTNVSDNEAKNKESMLKNLSRTNKYITCVSNICVTIKAQCANIDNSHHQRSNEQRKHLDVYACLESKCTITPLCHTGKDSYKNQTYTECVDSKDNDNDNDDNREVTNVYQGRITFIDCTELENSINTASYHRETETFTQVFFLRNVETHKLYLPCRLSVKETDPQDKIATNENRLTEKPDGEHNCQIIAVILDHKDLVTSSFDDNNIDNINKEVTKHVKQLCFEVVTLSL